MDQSTTSGSRMANVLQDLTNLTTPPIYTTVNRMDLLNQRMVAPMTSTASEANTSNTNNRSTSTVRVRRRVQLTPIHRLPRTFNQMCDENANMIPLTTPPHRTTNCKPNHYKRDSRSEKAKFVN